MIFDFFDSPELLDIQRTGFYRFLNQGIPELLAKEFPIKVKNGGYSLELRLNEKNVKLIAPEDDPRDCILKMKSYNCKLYAQVQIVCKKSSSSLDQEKIVYQSLPEWVLLGQLPIMTKRGHFIINGSPRVIVHQVVRAPGIYFQKLIKKDDQNKARFYGDIIPLKGVWVRLQMSKKGKVEAKFKKGKKVEVELLQKCLQVVENQSFYKLEAKFNEDANCFYTTLGSRVTTPFKHKLVSSLYADTNLRKKLKNGCNTKQSFVRKKPCHILAKPLHTKVCTRARLTSRANLLASANFCKAKVIRTSANLLTKRSFVIASRFVKRSFANFCKAKVTRARLRTRARRSLAKRSKSDAKLRTLLLRKSDARDAKRFARSFVRSFAYKSTCKCKAELCKKICTCRRFVVQLQNSVKEKDPRFLLYDDYSTLLDKKKSRAELNAEYDAFIHTYDKLYRTTQDKELEEWQKKKKNQSFFKEKASKPSNKSSNEGFSSEIFRGSSVHDSSLCKASCKASCNFFSTFSLNGVHGESLHLQNGNSSEHLQKNCRRLGFASKPLSAPYKASPYKSNKEKKKTVSSNLRSSSNGSLLQNKSVYRQGFDLYGGPVGEGGELYSSKPSTKVDKVCAPLPDPGFDPSFSSESSFKRRKCSENLFATFKLQSRYDLGLLGREKINNKLGLFYTPRASPAKRNQQNRAFADSALQVTQKCAKGSQNLPKIELASPSKKSLRSVRGITTQFVFREREQARGVVDPFITQNTLSNDCVNTQLTALDLCSATLWLYKLRSGEQSTDDIDHSQNRRVRTSGELLQTQFENGVYRLRVLLSTKLQEWRGCFSSSVFSSIFKSSCKTRYTSKKASFKRSKDAELSYLEKKSFVGALSNPSLILPGLKQSEGARVKRVRQKQTFFLTGQGFARDQKLVRKQSNETSYRLFAKELFSTKPITGALREFFGSNPLSQYMDQTNPLAEITHKRRISSLGIGGVSRESAGMAIRGIHPTHYGRICPIETPEGKNAGLVNSLAFYTKVDKNGFLKTPYYRVFKGQIQSSLGFSFCSANEELLTGLQIAPSDLQKSSNNILRTRLSTLELVPVRVADNLLDIFKKENPYKVQLIAISPIQMISVATSLIPFLEHNDANRALMGSNMQRQAVPLMISERAVVGTGLESTVIVESGHITESQISGFASHVSANKIIVDSLVHKKKEDFLRSAYKASLCTVVSTPRFFEFKGKSTQKRRMKVVPLAQKTGKPYTCAKTTVCRALPEKLQRKALSSKGRRRKAFSSLLLRKNVNLYPSLFLLHSRALLEALHLQLERYKSPCNFCNKILDKVELRSVPLTKQSCFRTYKADKKWKKAMFCSTLNHLCGVKSAKATELFAFAENDDLQKKARKSYTALHLLYSFRSPSFFLGGKALANFCTGARLTSLLRHVHSKNVLCKAPNKYKCKALLCLQIYLQVRHVQGEALQSGAKVCRALQEDLHLYKICKEFCSCTYAHFCFAHVQGFDFPHFCKALQGLQSKALYALHVYKAKVRGVLQSKALYAHVQGFDSPHVQGFALQSEAKVCEAKVTHVTQSSALHVCKGVQGFARPLGKSKKERCTKKQSVLLSTVSPLTIFSRSNQNSCITEKPLVREFDWVQKGDILSDCSASKNGELAVGKNVLLAYIPWEGYNFEDAIVISDRLVREHVYTSLHIERYVFQAQDLKDGNEWFTNHLPGVEPRLIQHLEESGLPKIGTFLKEGDIIVGKIRYLNKRPSSPYERLLCDILGEKNFAARNKSLYVPKGVEARVIYHKVISLFDNDPENKVRPMEAAKTVHLFLGEKRVVQVGDKISGRHGNKGVISTILPRQDMPYLPDGTPIDIILNPLGVPSRMNVGQVLECLLGLAATYLHQHFKISAFDERYGVEASKSIVFLKLYQARLLSGQNWLFQVAFPGKTRLVDGRSGECFDQWITVGRAYILKLIHMVSEKIHARSTGPYALITQQPLRGRSNKGGQRLGEMEVWALEGFGAAYTLQELLTKKSDDFFGRKQIVDSILPNPASIVDTLKPSNRIDQNKTILGHPEIFKVLLCELQALCLDLGVYIVTPDSFQRSFLGVVH